MHRLHHLINHFSTSDDEINNNNNNNNNNLNNNNINNNNNPVISSIKTKLILSALHSQFYLSKEILETLTNAMILEMIKGLSVPEGEATLRMIPSHVYNINKNNNNNNENNNNENNNNEKVYALDLGGTNFRVISMCLDKNNNNKLNNVQQKKYKIPEKFMRGDADGLFGFIALCIKDFINSENNNNNINNNINNNNNNNKIYPLGFTFSFPVTQTKINSGKLIKWTKGFKTTGVENQDVCELLQKQLIIKGVNNLNISALCNDTVGTLVARYFNDDNTFVGVILGTGSNACYWEDTCKIIKMNNNNNNLINNNNNSINGGVVEKNGDVLEKNNNNNNNKNNKNNNKMIINIEFGNFDSTHLAVLPITDYDNDINKYSLNPNQQRLEKLISGMYLGEIVRRILIDLSKNAKIISIQFYNYFKNKDYFLMSGDIGIIASDICPGYPLTRTLLKEKFNNLNNNNNNNNNEINNNDLFIIREICLMVLNRSAQLAAMTISAILIKIGKNTKATVAIDGALFENSPFYKKTLEFNLKLILGENVDINIVLQRDGSGLGAGYVAYLANSLKK